MFLYEAFSFLRAITVACPSRSLGRPLLMGGLGGALTIEVSELMRSVSVLINPKLNPNIS